MTELTPLAQRMLDVISIAGWTGTKRICLELGLTYEGDGSANHNLAYKPIKELIDAGLIEKRTGDGVHACYTQYQRKTIILSDQDLKRVAAGWISKCNLSEHPPDHVCVFCQPDWENWKMKNQTPGGTK